MNDSAGIVADIAPNNMRAFGIVECDVRSGDRALGDVPVACHDLQRRLPRRASIIRPCKPDIANIVDVRTISDIEMTVRSRSNVLRAALACAANAVRWNVSALVR